MNGVSVGALSDARTAHDTYQPSKNQEENPTFSKLSVGSTQSRCSSSVRSPLSNLPAVHVERTVSDDAPQPRPQDRVQNMRVPAIDDPDDAEVGNLHGISRRNNRNGNLPAADNDDIPENMYRPEKEDAEGWIHREKLAKIENEELQAAGINLAKARSRSRDALGGERLRPASRDHLRNDLMISDGNSRDEKGRKISSPLPITRAAQRDADQDAAERMDWDLRTPEEIAESSNSPSYSTPVLRKSGSKIPILTPSVSGTPHETPDKDPPVSRKRTMSGGILNDDALHMPKLRSGSGKWSEDNDSALADVSVKANSPAKSRQKSSSGGPGIASQQKTILPRKTSTAKTNPTTPNGRPKTRGNDTDKPRIMSNPPEGDPPWLADMYKPDPRLPPDQQLIPTLAKKQMQKQWEENGMIPKIYDRDLNALAVYENNGPPNPHPPQAEDSNDGSENSESWPIKSTASAQSTKPPGSRPAGPNSPPVTGGYSTMPKVTSPPMSMASLKMGTSNGGAPNPSTVAAQQPGTRPSQRLQTDEDDEKAQKKGCGCCIVM